MKITFIILLLMTALETQATYKQGDLLLFKIEGKYLGCIYLGTDTIGREVFQSVSFVDIFSSAPISLATLENSKLPAHNYKQWGNSEPVTGIYKIDLSETIFNSIDKKLLGNIHLNKSKLAIGGGTVLSKTDQILQLVQYYANHSGQNDAGIVYLPLTYLKDK